ncbi:MAG: toll/interleukin-1 receptor domain-containing protein [Erysipelotrichaceae bacterium]|nr:toll/interleukin-1 receptor domain-containing protein [Erysipelotrichaceae bacterium]
MKEVRQGNMAEKVFISYSHQDGSCARGIARYLERHGLKVWIDSKDLALGDRWANNIETALSEADVLIGILSSSSLRRKEVLKEINFGLKRMKEEGSEKFRVFFVVIGQLHPSWFKNDGSSDAIKEHLSQYQYINLSAYAEVTISAMKELLSAVQRKGIEESDRQLLIEKDDNGFINQNSQPEKAFDNRGNNIYYKVYGADLAPSSVYPFAMDKQWLPEIFYDKDDPYYGEFEKDGFASEKVKAYVEGYKKRNFALPFFHFKQVIIKLNTFLYEPYFEKLILTESEDKEAFKQLLSNGSIVILLNNEQMSPFVYLKPRNDRQKEVYDAWNELCGKTSVYCIRENWSVAFDQHSVEFLRFCSNMAMDHENNILLADAMHVDKDQLNAFLVTLKTISMQAFCQTHMNGTQAQDKVDEYSRSSFYENYIVKKSDPLGRDSIYFCLFDPNKPFHHELKRLIDIYYNSIFCNSLQCDALLPDDLKAENTYLHTLYLNTGEKEVSLEELEYAFSEFFDHCQILDEIEAIGEDLYLSNWDLSKIVAFRQSEAWFEYVELLEMIDRRSNNWKVDFNEIELLLQRLLRCFAKKETKTSPDDIAYSFRVLVGSKVLDIVRTERVSKIKAYGGSFADPGKIPLKVMFTIGDLTREDRKEMVFLPITLFSGRVDTGDGNGFFNALKDFMEKQCGFIEINQ